MAIMGQPGVNNFQTDLEFSLENNSDLEVNNAYYRAFPHLSEIKEVKDIETQKKGIDKILVFEAGNECFVDEKKRREDYGDILLEEYSDFDNKKPGWLGREKYTDYISYVILPTKKMYLFPFLILQKAWLDNYYEWLSVYGRRFAQNKTYRTSNIPIPTNVLLDELKNAYQLSL